MSEKLTDSEINYIEFICEMLPKTLKAIQKEQKDGYIMQVKTEQDLTVYG